MYKFNFRAWLWSDGAEVRPEPNRRLVGEVVVGALVWTAALSVTSRLIATTWLATILLIVWLDERNYRPAGQQRPRQHASRDVLLGFLWSASYAAMAGLLIERGGSATRAFAFVLVATSITGVLLRRFCSTAAFLAAVSPHLLLLALLSADLMRKGFERGDISTAFTPCATTALLAGLIWTTRRRLTDTWNKLTLATAQAAAGVEAKSQFLAGMSHELRTPLNGVLGMAQAMAADELTLRQRERLTTLRRAGESLLLVLDDLVDLSRVEADQPLLSDFDLPELVRDVVAAFDPLAREKGLSLECAIAPVAEGLCQGDAARLRRVLYGLVGNAIKFTRSGAISLSVLRRGDQVVFAVADTGIGIAPEALPHLFEAFYRADGSPTRAFEGAGLGLAVCHKLARLLGGDLRVESELGRGSTFTLTVQMPSPALAATPGALLPRTAAPELGHLRLLAAEDNPINRLVLETLLQDAGIAPTAAANGRDAVAAWEHGEWDVVLMDINMPVMDGVAATREIRRRERQTGRCRTPIIAVTANSTGDQVAAYLAAGMDHVVAKPICAHELIATISRALGDSHPTPAPRPALKPRTTP